MLRVFHLISNLNQGGAETVLERLCTHESMGIQHQVVSMRDLGVVGKRLLDAGIQVDCLNMPRGRLTLRGLMKLRHLVRAGRPNVIQTWLYHADLLGCLMGRLMGVPAVWGIHSSQRDMSSTPLTTRLTIYLCAAFSRYAPSIIICCSRASIAVHRGMGFSMGKATVIVNGYDLAVLRPESQWREQGRARLGVSPDALLVGLVGRWHPVKDHPTFLAALQVVKNRGIACQAVLIGPGMDPGNTELQSLIAKYGLAGAIHCAGATGDVAPWMNAMDLHVLSSLSESFPNVIAEAMACGTPCVTTAVGDAADIVGPHGWVVPPGNPQALADAIVSALQERSANQEAWRRRQVAGREWIGRRFGLERMVQRYQTVWGAVAHRDASALRNLHDSTMIGVED